MGKRCVWRGLSLLSIERLGYILAEAWDQPDLQKRLEDYGRITLEEADRTASFIGACYDAMPNFPLFTAFSMFYFAAASYSEMARRLDIPLRPHRFLACDHTEFGSEMRRLAAYLRKHKDQIKTVNMSAFGTKVAFAIARLNIAGLCDAKKRNHYGIDWEDVVIGAEKLGLNPETMRRILQTASWSQIPCPSHTGLPRQVKEKIFFPTVLNCGTISEQNVS